MVKDQITTCHTGRLQASSVARLVVSELALLTLPKIIFFLIFFIRGLPLLEIAIFFKFWA